MSPEVVRGELYVLPASSFRSQRGDESCAASIWTRKSNAGSMPNGACSSAVATHRTRTRQDSRGRSTWSRSARSTTPIRGGRCRCRALPDPCRSGNVPGARRVPGGPDAGPTGPPLVLGSSRGAGGRAAQPRPDLRLVRAAPGKLYIWSTGCLVMLRRSGRHADWRPTSQKISFRI
jgi:hypothetical protein